MIPPLVAAGYRVIVLTLSALVDDKPTNPLDYTFAAHVGGSDFVRRLSLTGINLVCQDWGGPIALRLVHDPDRFARVVVSNTGLADGRGISLAMAPKLRQLLAQTPVLNTEDCDNAMREGLGERGGFKTKPGMQQLAAISVPIHVLDTTLRQVRGF